MAPFKRGGVWWYKFYFAGMLIRESSKSTSKTVAKSAEDQRRRELEAGFHNLKEIRQQRIRYLKDVIAEYLVGYRLRYRSAAFADYALGHVSRLLGGKLIVDIDEAAVLGYLVAPSRQIEVTSDPDDNIFVECADAARADFLITGNRKHFPAFWKSTKIVTPREFVSLVAPHLIP